MYLPGQGAFIPLQATRQNMKAKQNAQPSVSVAKDNVQDKQPIESDNNITKTDVNASADTKVDKVKLVFFISILFIPRIFFLPCRKSLFRPSQNHQESQLDLI